MASVFGGVVFMVGPDHGLPAWSRLMVVRRFRRHSFEIRFAVGGHAIDNGGDDPALR